MVAVLTLVLALQLVGNGFESDLDRGAASLSEQAEWVAPLVWQPVTLTIATGNARQVTVEVRVDSPGGAVWVDGLSSPTLPVVNGSFSEPSPAGWEPSHGAVLEILPGGDVGGLAARVSGSTEGVGLRQSLPCEPLTVVEATLVLAVEGPDDRASVVLRAGSRPGLEAVAAATLVPVLPPSRVGRWVALLRPGARLTVALPEGPAALGVELDARGSATSALRCAVREIGGALIAEEELAVGAGWERLVLAQAAREAGGPVTVEIEARGGPLQVDNVSVVAPEVPFGTAAAWAGGRFVPDGPLLLTGERSLMGGHVLEPLRALSAALMAGRSGTGEPIEIPLVLDEMLAEEAYAIRCGADGLTLVASSPHGARYALLEAIGRTVPAVGDGRAGVLCGAVTHEPTVPWRGLRLGPEDAASELERASALRLNAVCLDPPNTGDFLAQGRAMAESCREARARDLEPVPVLRLWGASALSDSPYLAEGSHVEDEAVRLDGDGRATLSRPNVLCGPGRGLVVREATTGAIYEPEFDYVILPGEVRFSPGVGFAPDAEPWLVERAPGGAMREGARLLVSYDVGPAEEPGLATCPGLVQAGEALADQLRRLRALTECRWLRLDPGPVPPQAGDGPCRGTGRAASRLRRERIRQLALVAAEGMEPVRVLVPAAAWREEGDTDPAPWEWLPANAVVLVDAGLRPPAELAGLLAELCATPGRAWAVSVGDAPGVVEAWAAEAERARRAGSPCLGLLASSEGGRPAPALEVSRATWR